MVKANWAVLVSGVGLLAAVGVGFGFLYGEIAEVRRTLADVRQELERTNQITQHKESEATLKEIEDFLHRPRGNSSQEPTGSETKEAVELREQLAIIRKMLDEKLLRGNNKGP